MIVVATDVRADWQDGLATQHDDHVDLLVGARRPQDLGDGGIDARGGLRARRGCRCREREGGDHDGHEPDGLSEGVGGHGASLPSGSMNARARSQRARRADAASAAMPSSRTMSAAVRSSSGASGRAE